LKNYLPCPDGIAFIIPASKNYDNFLLLTLFLMYGSSGMALLLQLISKDPINQSINQSINIFNNQLTDCNRVQYICKYMGIKHVVDTVGIKETVVENRHRWLPNTGHFRFCCDLTKPAVTIVHVDGFN